MNDTSKETNVPLWTRAFIIVCLLNFLNFAGMWMLPSMLPVFIRDLGAPDYMLGWITGLTSIATIITRPLAGLGVERFGRRGVFTVGTIGMIVTALAFAVVPLVGAVLAVRFIQGLAWGFTNTSCSTIAADTIPKPRFAEGMGYFGLASSVAMIITPALSLTVFYAFGGQFSVMICAGFFMLSLLCSCFITYKKVEKIGTSGTDPKCPTTKPKRRGFGEFVRESLLERSALMAGAMMMLTASSYGLVQTFLPTMLEERAYEGVALFFIVMAVAAFVARPLFGRWADKRGYFEPALLAFICMSASMVVLALAHDTVLYMLAALLQGVGYSAGFSLFLAMATVKAAPNRRGSAIATVMVGFDIGSGLTAMILGVVAHSFGYEAIFICGAVIAAAGVGTVLARRKTIAGHSL